MKAVAILTVAAVLVAAPHTVVADEAPAGSIQIDGRVDHPLTLSPTDLAALPQITVDASFDTAHGKVSGQYHGVLLYTLITKAGIKADPAKQKHHLQDTILVTGTDGYTVAVALAEIDPDFEGKQVTIGTKAASFDSANKPTTKGLSLVVPGDKMGGRAVHDVAHIEIQ